MQPDDFPSPYEQMPPVTPRARKPKVVLIILLALLGVLLLAGTGLAAVWLVNSFGAEGQGEAEQSESQTQTPPQSNTPGESERDEAPSTEGSTSPPPAPASITLPNCPTLNPPAQQATQNMLDSGAELVPPPGEVGVAEFNAVFGPAARAAMAGTDQMRGCYYVFSFHDAMRQFVAEIDSSARDPLLVALRAEPLFTEGTIGAATTFISTHTEETSIGTVVETVAHAFVGDVWVSTYGSVEATGALTPAIDAVIAANPGLAAG